LQLVVDAAAKNQKLFFNFYDVEGNIMQILRSLTIVLLLAASAFSVQAAQVNVNKASAEEIAQALNGVGESKAVAIVEYRDRKGAFSKIEDLVLVKGIGKKTIEKNRHDILLSDN
jgi:competence protein ComEA